MPSSLFGGAASPEVLVRGWQDYFRERLMVELPERNLRSCVFMAGPDLREQGETPESSDPPCVLLLLHGGGHTSMSWALVASSLAKEHGISVLAMDFRAHGVAFSSFSLSSLADFFLTKSPTLF